MSARNSFSFESMDIKAEFQPVYRLPEKELRWVDHLFAKLSHIIGRLPVARDPLVNEIRQASLVRAAYSSALNDASCANIPVDRILNHILEDNHLCLEIGQYQDLELHLEKAWKGISISPCYRKLHAFLNCILPM